jgi:competence/damage-inducible protein CinA-like protein
MHIEIISIGNELLNGQTINSNAGYLSRLLNENGYQCYRHLAIPDDLKILSIELKQAFNQSDILICCGGLGPTLDDLTKDVISNLFGLELVCDFQVKENIKQRFLNYAGLEKDALVLKGSKVLLNNVGTAPGFIIENNNKALILLPGVPLELKLMFLEGVIPYLKEKFPIPEKIYQKRIGLFLILEIEVDILLRAFKLKYPKLDIGIYPSYGYIVISVKKVLSIFDDCSDDVEEVIETIKLNFPKNCFEKSIPLDLHQNLLDKKLKVAIAESLTGGAIASCLTKIPNASKYFEGGIVAYSNQVKIKHLHVNKNTIEDFGAVSVEVLSEMLDGLLNTTCADYALATSGIAGPSGGTDKKPVGTVCVGWANKENQREIAFIHIQGNREKVIEKSVNTALAMLLKKIKYNAYTFKK